MKTKSRAQDRQLHGMCPILEVLFPKVRAEVLRLLFSAPQKQRYVRELAAMSGLALSTVQDELRKLSAVGLITSWSNRFQRFYQPNSGHPLFPELVRIVELSGRLPQTTRSELRRPHRKRTRQRSRLRVPSLPPDRALKWNLFSPARKT